MKTDYSRSWWRVILVSVLLWGCGANSAYVRQDPVSSNHSQISVSAPDTSEEAYDVGGAMDRGWTERILNEDELLRLSRQDPDLSPSVSRAILARINGRAPYYVAEDIKNGVSLKVPNDFSLYKNWTPLPASIPELTVVPKFVLVVKDIPFLGWYERGELISDSHTCVGKYDDWTKAGIYRVRDKDADHVSRSYTNAFGQPAPMPWGLRIYEHVWIHAGDITGGYCSHGCINLPLMPAMQLFKWADSETVVVVLDSLGDLHHVLEKHESNCTLFAHKCSEKKMAFN